MKMANMGNNLINMKTNHTAAPRRAARTSSADRPAGATRNGRRER